MEMERTTLTISDILELRRNNMLGVNPEYQRGEVWTKTQKQKLIDSVLRGYPIPLLYFRYIKKDVAGMQREDLEIIDGQQRINALYEFDEGAYRLLDPATDKRGHFPNFLKKVPCPWADKDIHTLSEDLRGRLRNTNLALVKVTTSNENEARDLFIRLQSGIPLNAQEKRDAWPGRFTEFVLRVGGKPQIPRYSGHEFFRRVMRLKPSTDRGNTRQLAAQMAMLFLHRCRNGKDAFIDINAKAIDDFYYQNIDFDLESDDAARFVEILDILVNLLGSAKRPKMRGHEAIHLMLFVDSLLDDYTRSWEDKLADASSQFAANVVAANLTKDEPHPDEFWTQYGQWTRTSSDRADRIRRRHEFYVARMLGFLGPLQVKDQKRNYGSLEREHIYYRDHGKCGLCDSSVAWEEAEIHHIDEHSAGGKTVLNNGILVHRACHPKGAMAETFRDQRRT